MTIVPSPQEALLWHQLAHAKLKPAERMMILRAARAHSGEVADLTKWLSAGAPDVPDALRKALQASLEASVSESFLLEELTSQGIQVLTGRDPDYPKRFKRAFGETTPVVLYCAGEPALLGSRRTIAIVGARDASEEALQLTRRAAQFFAREHYTLVSGNARGVDHTAEEAALEAAGQVISVLPQGLLDKASGALIRKRSRALLDGHHLLLSDLHPKSRWQSRFAMMRNRLIMGMADMVLVVQTGPKESVKEGKRTQSGTWAGAVSAAKLGKLVFVLDLPVPANQDLGRELAVLLPVTPDDEMFYSMENQLEGWLKRSLAGSRGQKNPPTPRLFESE